MDRGSLKARYGSKYAVKRRRRKGDLNAVCDRQQARADPLLFTKRPATLTCPGIALLVLLHVNLHIFCNIAITLDAGYKHVHLQSIKIPCTPIFFQMSKYH